MTSKLDANPILPLNSFDKATIFHELVSLSGYLKSSIPLSELSICKRAILSGFQKCFSMPSASFLDMLNVHKNNCCDERFPTLSVFDRTLDSQSAFTILDLPFISTISSLTGMYPIDAYNLGYPSFTWRLVRPSSSNDIRGLHRDHWFRLAARNTQSWGGERIIDPLLPSQIQTIKVWLSISCVSGSSGLLVSPSSQLSEKPGFSTVDKDCMVKPIVNEKDLSIEDFVYANTPPGTFVLFGEDLMHGGAPTMTHQSRVSLEFTLASPFQKLYTVYY